MMEARFGDDGRVDDPVGQQPPFQVGEGKRKEDRREEPGQQRRAQAVEHELRGGEQGGGARGEEKGV